LLEQIYLHPGQLLASAKIGLMRQATVLGASKFVQAKKKYIRKIIGLLPHHLEYTHEIKYCMLSSL
jgi:hypothetical protein